LRYRSGKVRWGRGPERCPASADGPKPALRRLYSEFRSSEAFFRGQRRSRAANWGDMKIFAKGWKPFWIGALGLAWCTVLAPTASARAQETTGHALSDRTQILDLITRYYYNFGKSNPASFSDFYADDAELILGTVRFKGKDGIAKAYERAGKRGPSTKAYSFNVTISNPLIVMHGNTATAELIFTEFLIEKKSDAPRITAQGREYSTFVKVNGQWRYKTRRIEGGTTPPPGWKE
jgi:ketosteroid isomerase-like protein